MSAQVISFNRLQAQRLSRNAGIATDEAERLIETVTDPACRANRQELHRRIHEIGQNWILPSSAANLQIQNLLRVHFSVRSVGLIAAKDLPEALALVDRISESARDFAQELLEVREAFMDAVIGGGAPWTPWVKRKVKDVGDRPNWRELASNLSAKVPVAKARF